jgi:muramoyltetrapeptide carboxypeptidase
MIPPLYPLPLKKGDTIGIIAPAGQLHVETRFLKGVAILQEMGFQVKFPPDLWPGKEYLADTDDNRGSEFNRLIKDKEIKGLVAMRGGYGCLRMLDKIDIALVADNPKILLGFSDITILQNYLYEKTGLVSLHGPVVNSLSETNKNALARLHHSLTHIRSNCIDSPAIEVLREGPTVTAPLIGGNLASLVTLLGTRYDFSWDNKIVFLEDVNEPLYKIDRMLTQLKLAGKLDNISGLILGDFSNSINRNETEMLHYSKSLWMRVLELCCDHQEIPIWGNFPSGHSRGNFTFPLGAVAMMENGKTRLFFP